MNSIDLLILWLLFVFFISYSFTQAHIPDRSDAGVAHRQPSCANQTPGTAVASAGPGGEASIYFWFAEVLQHSLLCLCFHPLSSSVFVFTSPLLHGLLTPLPLHDLLSLLARMEDTLDSISQAFYFSSSPCPFFVLPPSPQSVLPRITGTCCSLLAGRRAAQRAVITRITEVVKWAKGGSHLCHRRLWRADGRRAFRVARLRAPLRPTGDADCDRWPDRRRGRRGVGVAG